ncbi:MAG: GNAT family N-acetyltransferase [Rhodobacteraceae bacterium]|nr:GNAT family N-acetyltransferase [Paracoccaceae bacterium]
MTPAGLSALIDATWPPAATRPAGPFLLREGRGGGQRVSAATAEAPWQAADIAAAETAQRALGQVPLFMIRAGEDALDAALAARGYRVVDPVVLYHAPVADLATEPPPPITTFCLWPMLQIMRDLWAEGGVGPGRIAVMERAGAPKTAILGRVNDRAAGVAFVGSHGPTAMLHALHVVPAQRRQGIAVKMMRAAAFWALDHGLSDLFLAVTEANAPARALYASLGMSIVEKYHYRKGQA